MKRLLALLTVLAVVAPAHAHFVWLVPKGRAEAQLIFSDNLEPDANVPITKIAQTKVFGRSMSGGGITAEMTAMRNYYLVSLDATTPLEVGGVCFYGIAGRKGDVILLNYYAKASFGMPSVKSTLGKGWNKLPLEIVRAAPGSFQVLWQGKPVKEIEAAALIPGEKEVREMKVQDDGTFVLGATPAFLRGPIGIRARYVEKKEGEYDGIKYTEIRHYATWTFEVTEANVPALQPVLKPDPAATKLLADARAGRAVWNNFPGFSADLDVNVNGKIAKGKVEFAASGKIALKLDADDGVKDWTRRTLASLVMHRLPGTDESTPCAFLYSDEQHPSGRAVRVLNDELHSSYRIRDGQILEVNRAGKETRFTITMLENTWNKEKQYLPVSYVVNSWDQKTNALAGSVAHHNTWTRVGAFDLPVTVRSVNAKAGELDNRLLTFSNLQLAK